VICDENGFIFNAFINLEPVQRSEDGCDMRRFRSFNHNMCARQFWIGPYEYPKDTKRRNYRRAKDAKKAPKDDKRSQKTSKVSNKLI